MTYNCLSTTTVIYGEFFKASLWFFNSAKQCFLKFSLLLKSQIIYFLVTWMCVLEKCIQKSFVFTDSKFTTQNSAEVECLKWKHPQVWLVLFRNYLILKNDNVITFFPPQDKRRSDQYQSHPNVPAFKKTKTALKDYPQALTKWCN